MPLDPVLAQGVTPINFAGPDPATKMNQLAMMMKMQGLQSEGQLNALKLTEAQREMADVEAIREAIRGGADFRDPKVASQYGAKGAAMSKALLDADSADLDRKTKIAAAGRDIWSRISDQTSYEAALPELEALRPGSIANLPRVFDPKLVAQNVMDAKTFLDRYNPQTELSKLIAARDSLPLGHPNRATYDAAIDKQTRFAPTDADRPSANVRDALWYANATDKQRKAFDSMQQGGAADPKKVAQTVADAAGNTRFFNAYGEEITPTSGAGAPTKVQGKPSATFEKTAALRQQLMADIDRTIPEIEEITKDGGLIDQSTGSGIGRGVDWMARGVGIATPGDLAISKLQPIADMVLKMVPRFEGPQSDKDTQSYKEAAGQLANSSLPSDIRKQAGREILRIMKVRKGQFVSLAMANEGLAAQEAKGAAPESPAAYKDADAIEWAKSNPSDPRAAQILKLNGM